MKHFELQYKIIISSPLYIGGGGGQGGLGVKLGASWYSCWNQVGNTCICGWGAFESKLYLIIYWRLKDRNDSWEVLIWWLSENICKSPDILSPYNWTYDLQKCQTDVSSLMIEYNTCHWICNDMFNIEKHNNMVNLPWAMLICWLQRRLNTTRQAWSWPTCSLSFTKWTRPPVTSSSGNTWPCQESWPTTKSESSW